MLFSLHFSEFLLSFSIHIGYCATEKLGYPRCPYKNKQPLEYLYNFYKTKPWWLKYRLLMTNRNLISIKNLSSIKNNSNKVEQRQKRNKAALSCDFEQDKQVLE